MNKEFISKDMATVWFGRVIFAKLGYVEDEGIGSLAVK